MAELIAAGTTLANSADITLAAGESATIFLKSGSGPTVDTAARAAVQIKSSGAAYFTIGELDRATPVVVIDAPGTYRVQRMASSASVGVDQEGP